jgi:hypothetical protein
LFFIPNARRTSETIITIGMSAGRAKDTGITGDIVHVIRGTLANTVN